MNKTIADRNQYVAKSNSIIRTRYRLTLQQQRLILFCISKIKPRDTINQRYTFTIDQICEACGLNGDSGFYYKTIKDDLIKLTTREWGIMPDGTQKTISWIGDVDITPSNGTVSITFNPNMEPYLFELKNNYTQYKLANALVFRSKHTLRLYEILRSYTTKQAIENGIERTVMYSVAQFRRILACEKQYPLWAEFERNVIKKAVKQINSVCDDIHVEYETYKTGRSIENIEFIITTPTGLEMLNAIKKKREILR